MEYKKEKPRGCGVGGLLPRRHECWCDQHGADNAPDKYQKCLVFETKAFPGLRRPTQNEDDILHAGNRQEGATSLEGVDLEQRQLSEDECWVTHQNQCDEKEEEGEKKRLTTILRDVLSPIIG